MTPESPAPATRSYEQVYCPMPDCDAELYITHTLGRAIYADDTVADLADLHGAHTQTWTVGCTEGHVVLLPASHAGDSEVFGEECEDDEGHPHHRDLERLHALAKREEASR